MDAKSDDDATEPRPAAPDPQPDAFAEEVTEPRPAVAPSPPEVSRKAARRDARRRPLNPDDPEPAWLSRGSGRRTVVGIALTLVVIVGVAALGWVLFKPDGKADSGDPKLTAEACRVTEHDDEAVKVRPPSSLGEAEPRSTATVTTNRGPITVLLFGDVSPCGVSGFEYLTQQGFYKNNPCYRLTTQPSDPTVTLRCGDPTGSGKGGPGYRYQAEDAFTGEVGRDYVALINDREGRSGSSFAFVRGQSKPTASLSVIGQVIAGQEVLDQIGAAAGVEPFDDEPSQPVVIEKITIAKGAVTLPPPGSSSTGGTGDPSGGASSPSGSGTATPSPGGSSASSSDDGGAEPRR